MRESIDVQTVFVTPHAALKASDIFGIEYGAEARQLVKNKLRVATYVSEIVGKDGKVDRLFAHRRTAFILDRNEDVVITIYQREDSSAEVRNKVRDLLFDHLSELEDREQEKEDDLLRLSMEKEILKEFEKVGIEEAGIWLSVIDREISDKEAEMHAYRVSKSRVAKGVVAYL